MIISIFTENSNDEGPGGKAGALSLYIFEEDFVMSMNDDRWEFDYQMREILHDMDAEMMYDDLHMMFIIKPNRRRDTDFTYEEICRVKELASHLDRPREIMFVGPAKFESVCDSEPKKMSVREKIEAGIASFHEVLDSIAKRKNE